MPESLYRSYSLEKSTDGISGSISFYENSPYSPFDIGDTFRPVEGGPLLNVDKVSIKDNVIGEQYGKVLRQWEITIEGSSDGKTNSQDNDSDTHVKYSFTIGTDETSGTMEVVNSGKTPALSINIGDKFSIPGIGQVTCNQVKGNDSYDDYNTQSWTVIYEGSSKAVAGETQDNLKYSVNAERNSEGIITYSGTVESTNTGDNPKINCNIGETFSVPFVGTLTCTSIKANDDFNDEGVRVWTVICEGSRTGEDPGQGSDDSSMPDNETTFTYEINGSTVRTVAGEFIALRKSDTPITRKSITLYNDSVSALTSPGEIYQGGIVTSESISKEVIKSNGVIVKSYYKHNIEVEF